MWQSFCSLSPCVFGPALLVMLVGALGGYAMSEVLRAGYTSTDFESGWPNSRWNISAASNDGCLPTAPSRLGGVRVS